MDTSHRAACPLAPRTPPGRAAGTPDPGAPRQVVDVLTQRLLDREPGLLEPLTKTEAEEGPPPPTVESIVLQRNQLETSALSVAAMRGASWSAIRLLLKPSSGIEVVAHSAAACLTADELLADGAEPPSEEFSLVAGERSRTGPRKFSYRDLAARMRALGLGVLIGWRRVEDTSGGLHHRAATVGTVATAQPSRRATPTPAGPVSHAPARYGR